MALEKKSKVDTQEFELPETVYSRDIENQVFQEIVLQTLASIEGITLIEGNFFDSLLGRESLEGIKGIWAEQDSKNQSINIKIEINIFFGISIPEKAREIQENVDEKITELTGLHVSCIHVVFKNIVHNDRWQKLMPKGKDPTISKTTEQQEYNDQF